MVPRLKTALAGLAAGLSSVASSTGCRRSSVGSATQWQEHAVPFYASVDLRNAGFKLAPVDTNLCFRAASTT